MLRLLHWACDTRIVHRYFTNSGARQERSTQFKPHEMFKHRNTQVQGAYVDLEGTAQSYGRNRHVLWAALINHYGDEGSILESHAAGRIVSAEARVRAGAREAALARQDCQDRAAADAAAAQEAKCVAEQKRMIDRNSAYHRYRQLHGAEVDDWWTLLAQAWPDIVAAHPASFGGATDAGAAPPAASAQPTPPAPPGPTDGDARLVRVDLPAELAIAAADVEVGGIYALRDPSRPAPLPHSLPLYYHHLPLPRRPTADIYDAPNVERLLTDGLDSQRRFAGALAWDADARAIRHVAESCGATRPVLLRREPAGAWSAVFFLGTGTWQLVLPPTLVPQLLELWAPRRIACEADGTARALIERLSRADARDTLDRIAFRTPVLVLHELERALGEFALASLCLEYLLWPCGCARGCLCRPCDDALSLEADRSVGPAPPEPGAP